MRNILITESQLKFLIERTKRKNKAKQNTVVTQPDPSVKEVQGYLKKLGYDLGVSGPTGDGVDGRLGGRTTAAIKDYQTKVRLNPTGVIDNELKAKLKTEFDRDGGPKQYGKGVVTGPKSKETPNKKEEKKKPSEDNLWVDCVTKSPKVIWRKDTKGGDVALINGFPTYYFYVNGKVFNTKDRKLGNYYCYKNGIKMVFGTDKTYIQTGVVTNTDPKPEGGLIQAGIGSGIMRGFKNFIRKTFPNFAQLFATRPLSSNDFTDGQKEVIFNVIQKAIARGKGSRTNGCVEYIDYSPETDAKLNKTGGASFWEMMMGSATSDEFRVATLLGRFCYKLSPNGSYYISDKYDFHKWSTFTVTPKEVEGMSHIEKLIYVGKKTIPQGLSPYGVLRHVGWLEHPDNAPAWTKTPVNVTVEPGLFAKNKLKNNPNPNANTNDNVV